MFLEQQGGKSIRHLKTLKPEHNLLHLNQFTNFSCVLFFCFLNCKCLDCAILKDTFHPFVYLHSTQGGRNNVLSQKLETSYFIIICWSSMPWTTAETLPAFWSPFIDLNAEVSVFSVKNPSHYSPLYFEYCATSKDMSAMGMYYVVYWF